MFDEFYAGNYLVWYPRLEKNDFGHMDSEHTIRKFLSFDNSVHWNCSIWSIIKGVMEGYNPKNSKTAWDHPNMSHVHKRDLKLVLFGVVHKKRTWLQYSRFQKSRFSSLGYLTINDFQNKIYCTFCFANLKIWQCEGL